MRKDPFGIGDYLHVYNRGNRTQPIVKDNYDRIRFLQSLYYFNTENTSPNPIRKINLLKINFNKWEWPEGWQARKPIIKIMSFVLFPTYTAGIIKVW